MSISIVFVGDYVKRTTSNSYNEVVDVVDSMTVLLDDGSTCRADDEHISDLKSKLEYTKFVNNFGI